MLQPKKIGVKQNGRVVRRMVVEDKQSIQPFNVGESIKPCTNILIFLLPKIMLKVQS